MRTVALSSEVNHKFPPVTQAPTLRSRFRVLHMPAAQRCRGIGPVFNIEVAAGIVRPWGQRSIRQLRESRQLGFWLAAAAGTARMDEGRHPFYALL